MRPSRGTRGAASITGPARARGAAVVVAVAALSGLALAACSSGPSTAARSTTGTRNRATTTTKAATSTTAAPPTSSAPPTTSPPTSTTSGSSVAKVTTCTAAQLGAAGSGSIGAGGFVGSSVTFTNHGSQACTMDGFPGMDLLASNGATIVHAARGCAYLKCPTSPTSVTLAPSGTSHFTFDYRDNPSAPTQTTCPTSATALVTPPNAYDHVSLPLKISVCGIPPFLGVGTVQPGPAGT